MKLIADSGSTKTTWVLIDNNKVIKTISTPGYNPYYYDTNSLTKSLKNELYSELKDIDITEIHYYGSGCSTETNCSIISNSLLTIFKNANIIVNHDLYGAAVALLQNREGIACILGTGSNSCLWDGKQIIGNVPSTGYLLGDEGSGTYIGMKILKGILEEKAPAQIIEKFHQIENTNLEIILKKIYGTKEPNRYISTISKFAGDNIDNMWIKQTVEQVFTDFIDNHISYYNNYQEIDVSFTGSVAHFFKNELFNACKKRSVTPGIILKNPIEGLIKFHTCQQ